jgi:hypothetical protein
LIPRAKALALATSDSIPESGHRKNPLAIRLRNCVFGRSDQANPARRTRKKRSAFT